MKLTPNQVTAISAVFTFAGLLVVSVSPPQIFNAVVAVLLLAVGYALDSADGQLARLRGGGSAAGEWLDHVVDAFKANLLHITVLLYFWQHYRLDAAWYLVPLGYTVVASVFFFAVILTDQLRRQHRGKTSMFLQGEGHSSLLYSLAVMPTDYGLMIVVFGLIWWPQGFLPIYSALLIANVVFLALALPKWFREVGSLARA
jgi:phosphatidylglycerophosphate synthase